MDVFLKSPKRYRIVLLLVAGVLLRWLYLFQFSSSPLLHVPVGPDVREYHDWAREMVAIGLLWDRVHIHAPLYPAFLAALYRIFAFDLLWTRIAQLACGVAGILVCTLAIKRYAVESESKSESTALVFAGIALLYPPLIYYQSELVSEALLFTLLCLTVALLYHGESAVSRGFASGSGILAAAGLALGLAVITHPMTLVFLAAETLWLLFSRTCRDKQATRMCRIAVVAAFLVPAAMVVAPISIYNSYLAGRPILIQEHSGFNFYLGNNPEADGTCYLRPGAPWDEFHANAEESARQLGIDKDRFLVSKAVAFIVESPLDALGLAARKLLYVWNFRELVSGADPAPLRERTALMRGSRYAFALLGVLAFGGVVLALGNSATLFAGRHFMLLLASFWLAQTLTVVSGRYRVAMYPAFFFFAALFIVKQKSAWKIRSERVRPVVGLLLGCALVWLPRPPRNAQQETAEACLLLGEAYFKQGDYVAAEEHLKHPDCLAHGSAKCYNLLGMIADSRSRETAATWFERAIEAAPDEAEGYMNLAIIASRSGDKDKAERLFGQALEKRSHEPDLYYNYGYFLQRQADFEKAEHYYKLSLDVAPSYRTAINALGVLYLVTGKTDAAVAQFRRAVALEPGNHDLMVNLALAEAMTGNKAGARRILDRVLRMEPKHPAASQLRQRLSEE